MCAPVPGSVVVKTWAHECEVVSSSLTYVQWRCASSIVILSPSPCGVRSHSPPVHPAANGDLEYFWGANSLAISHTLVMGQVGLRVPTPLTRRDGQSPLTRRDGQSRSRSLLALAA